MGSNMRLIDADALHDYMRARKKWVVKSDGKHNEGYTYDQVHFGIDAQPTVDAVPVVRCKDCKHYGSGYFAGCPVRNVKSPNDFCCWAERKDDETD